MKKLLVIYFLTCFVLLGQEKEWNPKSFDSLDVELKQEDFQLDEELDIKYSKGYFPVPLEWNFNIGIFSKIGYISNAANNITPSGLVTTNKPYKSEYNSDSDYLDFKEKYSDDDDGSSQDNEIYSVGLEYLLTPDLGIPLQIRASTLITWNTSILYSEDKSKSYLDYDKGQSSFLEIGNIILEETNLEFNAGINIPIYGAFVKSQVKYQSLYTLYFGVSMTEVLSSESTQYLQIGDAKDKIRYENGLDTINLVTDYELPTLRGSRLAFETGIGMNFIVNNFGLLYELTFTIPHNSILKDDIWKQSMLRFNTAIYLR